MDTITHGIVGALIGKCFAAERDDAQNSWIATFAVTAGAVFPDVDTFIPPFYHDRLAYIEIHRGLTHSLVMLPLFALLFGWVTGMLLSRREKSLFYSSLYGIGIASHIFLDVVTSYGTMVWSPISKTRLSWDWIFIIDVVFTSIALLPQLIAWVYSDQSRAKGRGIGVWLCCTVAGGLVALAVLRFQVHISTATLAVSSLLIAALLWLPSWRDRGFGWHRSVYCRAGLAALAIYLCGCAVAHHAALARVEDFAASAGIGAQSIAALPAPPSMFRWSGLVESRIGVYRESIDLREPSLRDSTPVVLSREAVLKQSAYQLYPNAPDNPYIRTAKALPQVKTFLWFARFPWITYFGSSPQLVEIKDAQFLWPPRSGDPPFTFRIFFNRQGKVLSTGLLTR